MFKMYSIFMSQGFIIILQMELNPFHIHSCGFQRNDPHGIQIELSTLTYVKQRPGKTNTQMFLHVKT